LPDEAKYMTWLFCLW